MHTMQNRPLVLGLLLAQALLISCTAPTTGTPRDDGVKPLQVTSSSSALRFDAATIDSASIAGDVLSLHVTHGGGCTTHTFGLHTSGIFLESYPVQVPAQLSHDAADDRCRALVRPVLRFDLSALRTLYQKAYGARGELVLNVQAPGGGGASTSVRYVIQ
ncbi:MAG TPA: hypothetical protein DGD08_00730 [Gemmatimonas aurantiaca]|uniref:Lipoprotein n=2 Tax=Gemmatimonas aurantiaca TaxID=173480 RepID=C1A4Y9_GEMAT|nr:hypothetical protein [Gemmatimonas aurantiaca]BAH37299.1 hypothetical protein GAU_0257 [Gemmatimonas aurantiaca T-27]HCT55714.1 hypothetical protein [Gemmatimonas aurantiaca]